MKQLAVVLLIAGAACAPAVTSPAPAPPAPAAPAAAAAPALPLSIRWSRGSAEHDALFLQAYRVAEERVRAAEAALPDGGWAVILDADETVIDNSIYQKERAEQGLPYSSESWNEWVRRRAAPALPGAAEFTRAVRALGGRVVIVTNRDEPVCEPTRENLRAVGIAFDAVLCRQGTSDKNPRFQAVEQGTAAPALPPARVLLWVGDNVQDFPGLSQAARTQPAALAEFGRRFIVLPNPMYGSWEQN
jgi:5'-nucleotidase (lipoprotein e(P4) family)